MSRLTSEPFRRKSDDSLENYKVRRKGREEWETLAQNAINKLGKLEDLMEEYNINSIEELELLINSHKKQEEKIIDLSADLGMFQNENINLTKDIEKYWNIEEELGCPLKLLIRGFIDSNKLNDDLDYKQKIMVYNCNGKLIEGFEMELSGGEYIDIAVDGEDNNNDYDIETITVKIKDYGKTWWLKEEKENE